LFLAVLLAALALAAPVPAAAAPAEEARLALTELADRSLPRLAAARTADERAVEVRRLLRDSFDLPGMGRFMLGRYWRQASEQERRDYLLAFEDLVVGAFAGALEDHTVERVKINTVRGQDDDAAIVHSEIVIAGKAEQPFRVDWHLRRLDGRYRVYDVVVEGLSIGILLRDAFVQATQAGGGSVTDFIKRLRFMSRPN